MEREKKKNLETGPVFFTPYVLSFKRSKTDFDKTKGDKNMSWFVKL